MHLCGRRPSAPLHPEAGRSRRQRRRRGRAEAPQDAAEEASPGGLAAAVEQDGDESPQERQLAEPLPARVCEEAQHVGRRGAGVPAVAAEGGARGGALLGGLAAVLRAGRVPQLGHVHLHVARVEGGAHGTVQRGGAREVSGADPGGEQAEAPLAGLEGAQADVRRRGGGQGRRAVRQTYYANIII